MGNPNNMEQYSPDEWGAQINYDSFDRVVIRDGATVHYTGTRGTQKNLLANSPLVGAECRLLGYIEQDHLDQGWDGIGYSHAVGPSGNLYRCRGEARGAHNPGDSDGDGFSDNEDSYGLLLMVGPGENPTAEMYSTARAYLDAVGGTIAGHKESRATRCPGDILMEWINNYRDGNHQPEPVQDDTPPASNNWTNTMIKNLPTRKKRSDLGKTSDWDRKVQGLLAATGHLDIQSNLDGRKFDGKFGASTEKAVKAFQRSATLTVDGIVGEQTWEGLIA